MIRQGDVLLRKITKLPEGMKPSQPIDGRLILAYGETTGHHHSVTANVATLFEDGNKMVLAVREPTILDHQEHAQVEIMPGIYWVVRQREYTPQAIRRVLD